MDTITTPLPTRSYTFDQTLGARERKLVETPFGKMVLRVENYSARRTTPDKAEISRRLVSSIMTKDPLTTYDLARCIGISSSQLVNGMNRPATEYDKLMITLPATWLKWENGVPRARVFYMAELNEWASKNGDEYVNLYLMTKVPKGKR